MSLDQRLERFDVVVNIREVCEGENRFFLANRPIGSTVRVNPDYYAPLPDFITYRGMKVFVHKNSDFYKRLALTDLHQSLQEAEAIWKKQLYEAKQP